MIRGLLAVLAGIAVLTITSFAIEAAADLLLMRLFPRALPDRAAIGHNLPASLFMFAYTTLCVVAGGYATAWVARRAPVWHATLMGVVQVALTVWAMISLRHQAPLRNWIVALVLTLPAAAIGGVLRAEHAKSGRG
jgi:drug/metabolite transporter superfamily protein YnfA